MKKKVLSLFLCLITSSVFLYGNLAFGAENSRQSKAASSSFQDDINYFMATLEIWYHLASGAAKSPSEFIENSRSLAAQYRNDKTAYPQYKHSEKAEEEIFFLFDQTMLIYNAIASKTSSIEDFFEQYWKATISTREALLDCKGYANLHKDFQRATQEAIQEVQKNQGGNTSSLEELQYVFSYRYQWQNNFIKKEEKSSPKSGDEYVELAIQAYEDLKMQLGTPPSQQALAVGIEVVEKTIEILKAANQCALPLEDFLRLTIKPLEKLEQAFEKGLLQDKALLGVSQRVSSAYEEALLDLNSCVSQK